MPADTSTPPQSYQEAYEILARISEQIETGEADIDQILPLLEEARAAYALCQSRIEALDQLILELGWQTEDLEDSEAADGEDDADADFSPEPDDFAPF